MSMFDIASAYPCLITFRLAKKPSDAEYRVRREMLVQMAETVAVGGAIWPAPTSCLVFRTAKSVDEVAYLVARVIKIGLGDIALGTRLDAPDAVIVGSALADAEDLIAIVPYARKFQ